MQRSITNHIIYNPENFGWLPEVRELCETQQNRIRTCLAAAELVTKRPDENKSHEALLSAIEACAVASAHAAHHSLEERRAVDLYKTNMADLARLFGPETALRECMAVVDYINKSGRNHSEQLKLYAIGDIYHFTASEATGYVAVSPEENLELYFDAQTMLAMHAQPKSDDIFFSASHILELVPRMIEVNIGKAEYALSICLRGIPEGSEDEGMFLWGATRKNLENAYSQVEQRRSPTELSGSVKKVHNPRGTTPG